MSPVFLVVLGGISLHASDTLPAVLGRIDHAAAGFKGISADIRRVTHTEVINEDTVDVGTVKLKRTKPREMRMLIDLSQPDPKSVAISGRKAEIYYPRIQTVQEYDLGKNRELVDQFFLLGFGTSSDELEKAYTIKLAGPETLHGQKTSMLEMVPKSKEILQHLKKFQLWVSDTTGYPVQQEFFLPGQYIVVTYTNLVINPPLPDSALKLQLPKGVKREFPQK